MKNELRQRVATDPFDMQAQAEIEQMIKKKNILENMENALEHIPEAFTQVHMLYVSCKVNGVALKAFVDTGAQMTIMTRECAEKCNILRLMDERFAGMAVGVGTAVILGRVHITTMSLGDSNITFPVSITVLDQQGIDFSM